MCVVLCTVAGGRAAIKMADTTAERETETADLAPVLAAAGFTHGRNGREVMNGESRGRVHVASVSVVPSPSTKVKAVRAGEMGAEAGAGAAERVWHPS